MQSFAPPEHRCGMAGFPSIMDSIAFINPKPLDMHDGRRAR
jgi:hypothetical protein